MLRPALPDSGGAVFLSELTWTSPSQDIGGLSALHVHESGTDILAITDRGRLLTLDVQREGGRLSRVTVRNQTDITSVPTSDEAVLDSEGLAVQPEGTTWVSFEQDQLIRKVDPATGAATPLPAPDAFAQFGGNRGLEALAVDASGHLFVLPERPDPAAIRFAVWRWDGDGWDQAFEIIPRNGFLAVSADFGPDGRFYLLERKLTFLGFQTRLRRWDVSGGSAVNETLLMTSRAGEFGNLEGVSLWHDGDTLLRATMVSDNNFWPVMRMQVVEFVLPE